MLTDWKSAASAWWSAWLRGLIAFLPLGLFVIVLDAPLWLLIMLWTYPFGRMSYEMMHSGEGNGGQTVLLLACRDTANPSANRT